MLDAISMPRWSSFVVRGVFAIIFGVIAFTMPSITLFGLVVLFGVYAAADGLVQLVNVAHGATEHKVWLILQGIVGLIAAAVAFIWPGMTALVLLYVIAAWAIARGVFLISGWWSTKSVVQHAWAYALDGLVSIAFGILLIASPVAGALALAWIVATYAIVIGVTDIAMGLTVRGTLGVAPRP